MKKFYTLFFALLMASFACAQTFTVKVQGKTVSNGEEVKIHYDEYPVEWLIPGELGIYDLNPGILLEADAEQTISVTVSDDIKDGVLQNCAFEQCIPVTADACPVTSEGKVPAGETELAIHLGYGTAGPGAELTRSFNVSVSNGAQTVSFSVTFEIGVKAEEKTFTIKVLGEAVSDGEAVKLHYDEYPVEWLIPGELGIYDLNPGIMVNANVEQAISVTVSDDIKDGVLQNCAFEQCIPVTEDACPVTSEGTVPAGETDLAIHLGYGTVGPGAELTRSFNVSVSNGEQTVSFSVTYEIGTTPEPEPQVYDFSVLVEGKAVEDGETAVINLVEFPEQWTAPEEYGGQLYYVLSPSVVLQSAGEQEITVTTTDDVLDGSLVDLAFANTVIVTEETNPSVKTHVVPKGKTELFYEVYYGFEAPALPLTRSFTVSVTNGEKTVTFSIELNVSGKSTSVAGVRAQQSTERYRIDGIQTSPTHLKRGAIYIKDGKKFIMR
ncbi:MAG: hypothetical protein KBT12_00405 [Bacteroidales bacterium]|nr:hypothetical protein [Candidatus Physcousia equi]